MTLKKFLDYAIKTLVGLVIAWCIWATQELYAQKTNAEVNKESTKKICQDIQELKVKADRAEEKRDQDQKDLMKELLKIQRQLKK